MHHKISILECIHQCSQNDTCTTEATWYGGKWTHWANGFCFSSKFGGSCHGIPEPCDSCRSACEDRNGQHTTPLKFGQNRPSGSRPFICKMILDVLKHIY